MYATGVSKRFAASDDASALAAYLREISKLSRLTADEERALGARIRHDADQAAVTRLVEANLRFVVSFAKRYRGLGVAFLDLIHEGNLGLIEAAHRFDPSHNVKFITYAVWWVRESMMHVLADQTRAFSFPPKLFFTLHRVPGGGADLSVSEPIGVGRAGNTRFGALSAVRRHGVEAHSRRRRDGCSPRRPMRLLARAARTGSPRQREHPEAIQALHAGDFPRL